MKTKFTKVVLTLMVSVLFLSACKKDKADNSVALAGSWKISKYDGQLLQSPAFGTFAATSTSATTGTANFVISFNGTNNNKENDSFVMSDSNTKVAFTKTDGDFTVLSGGGTWTINIVDEHNLKMTSQYGLTLEMTK